jgi:hypothetical protein
MPRIEQEITRMNARLSRPEAEVWIRLRRPTGLEAVARELAEDAPPLSDELMRLCSWIVDRAAEGAPGNDGFDPDALVADTADIHAAAQQLIATSAPLLDDPDRLRDAIDAWIEEWGWTLD